MASEDQITVGNASKSSVSSEPPKETGTVRGPDIVLRTFQPSDLPYAKHIYYSTYFGQVPQGVKSKLLHPLTWALFIASYAYLLALVPIILSDMNFPWWSYPALRIFITFAWTILAFAGLFVYTDRKEAVDGIEDAMCNDMKDIEQYYLGWSKEERVVEDDKDFQASKVTEGSKKVTFDKSSKAATETIRTRKPDEERTASQFWVLTINSIPSATVAIDQHYETVYNAREVPLAPWKQAGQFLCRRYHLSIPKFLEGPAVPKRNVLFPAHKKNEASLQRLAIQGEYQGFGLSNILISRAMMWANEHNIEYVNATVNQMQKPALNILKDKHGFRQISRKSTGWFGQYEVELQCSVKDWVENYERGVKAKEESDKQLKEENLSKEQ